MDVLSNLARRHERIVATDSKSAMAKVAEESGCGLSVGEEQEEDCDEVGCGLHLELCRIHDAGTA